MSFDSKVDYIPSHPFTNAAIDPSEFQHKTFQKRKWQVLITTFLLILITANAVIWIQSPIYQSQATLHFSYTSQTKQEFAELAQRQITLHQQRMKSNNVLSFVAKELEQSQMLIIKVQTLFDALVVEASLTGRIITLKANGSDPQILKPIIDINKATFLVLLNLGSFSSF